ncbi:MAG: type IV pilus biogenesis/stability protein PilW [Burkholderiales bacterium]
MSARSMIRRVAVACSMAAAVIALGAGCANNSSNDGSQSRPPSRSPADRPFDARVSAKAHTELAAGYLELGNLAVAFEEATLAVSTDGSYALAHSMLGLVQTEMREVGPAQASFDRALRLDAKDPDINHNYGWFLCQTGRERESVKFFMTATSNPLYPSPARSHASAGICLQKIGDVNGALAQIDRALQIDANHASALFAGARLDLTRRDIERSRIRISRFNQITSPTAESLWLALRIERLRGDKGAEASFASQLRRRFPGSKEFQAYERGQFE